MGKGFGPVASSGRVREGKRQSENGGLGFNTAVLIQHTEWIDFLKEGKEEWIDRQPHCYTIDIMRLSLLFSSLVVLSLAGCSSVQITPQTGQRVFYNHGDAIVVGVKKNGEKAGIVMQGLGDYGGGRVAFGILYHNKTKSLCEFSIANIVALNAKGKKLRIYTAEELEREARTRAAIAAACIAMGQGAQSFAAAQPTYTTASGGFNGYTPYGNYSGSYYGSSTSYNPAQQIAANQAIQANTATQLNSVASGLNQVLGSISQVLSRTTVPPNGCVQGMVIVKKSSAIYFKVLANGEEVPFEFLVK
jgi:hypothetical protein